MKYKVGDKVKIIGNSNNHGFEISQVVVIGDIHTDTNGDFYYISSQWGIKEKDITDPDSAFDRVGNKVTEETKEKVSKVVKDYQIGGNIKPNHYPNAGENDLIKFALDNNIGAIEFNVCKYVVRWKDKNGIDDLKKCREYLDRLIEWEEKQRI